MAKKYKRKRKNKSGTIFIILFFLFIICLALFSYYKDKELSVSIDKKILIYLNDEFYYNDAVKDLNNGKIVSNNNKLDTSKAGNYNIEIEVEDVIGNKKKYDYEVTVRDINPPVIYYQKRIKTTLGNKIDLLNGVGANDDSGENINVHIEGHYDFDKVGNYILHYVASDSSNNTTREEFTLVVEDKPKNNNNTNTFVTSKGFKGVIKDGITYIDGYLIANKTYSLPSTYNPGLTSETKENANIMFADAKKDGLNIYISSGFRTYTRQQTLYNNYVKADGQVLADTYSARPGHSEHQSGLAFDVNQIGSVFNDTPEAKWLHDNCYKYGFILRYPKNKTNETGYMYESWHFRYVGVDLATKLYNNGDWITMEEYFGISSEYN